MRHGSLFSGQGGFDLAAEWMGWENLFHCEKNEFCQRILKYYWPDAELFKDIQQSSFSKYRGRIDVLSGGFPCQPFSNAGEQKGSADERFLFKEMFRAIREIKPPWVVAENVRAITSPKFKEIFHEICTSLEFEGYEVSPILIPVTAIGADHERYRTWIVAHSECERQSGQGAYSGQLQPKEIKNWEANRFVNYVQGNAMPYVCGHHDGISRRMDEQALFAIGNAIHPGIAYEIFKTIEQYEKEFRKD